LGVQNPDRSVGGELRLWNNYKRRSLRGRFASALFSNFLAAITLQSSTRFGQASSSWAITPDAKSDGLFSKWYYKLSGQRLAPW